MIPRNKWKNINLLHYKSGTHIKDKLELEEIPLTVSEDGTH